MHDAIVIGSGPNGLVAANELARHGWSVLVLEAQDRPGGALWSVENTLPGYVHDVGAAFFPFGLSSPALKSLKLEEAGLQWRNAEYESAHPAPDGSCAAISRNVELAQQTFGEDARAWVRFHRWQENMGPRLAEALLAPLPDLAAAWRLGMNNLFSLGLAGMTSSAGYARRHFRTEPARRIIPAMAMHVDLGPNDFGSAALGLVLTLLAAQDGFRVPVGGAKAITEWMLKRLNESGGEIQLGTHVDEILIREKRPVAVKTANGIEIPVCRAVLAGTTAPALYLNLIPNQHTPNWLSRSMRRFSFAWGTFKMDWALSGPVPWQADAARHSAVVHAGDSLDDLIDFTNQVRAGELPDNPYLVIGQQSLIDATRAPEGCHTLWAYSRVPTHLSDGWVRHKDSFADRIEKRIELLAPGFCSLIQARSISAPDDLEKMDENLVGGDLSGGSNRITQQLFFRPVFPYFRYRTHIRGVYLASASAHPGAGVHGACGFNAAQTALRDFG